MKGGFCRKSDGFTILEILIVLTVTGALFVSAIIMMADRQRQADFNTSIRDVQSQLQQSISEVGSGFYPSQNDFSCTAEVPGPKLSKSGAVNQQGSNEGCIFLGKVIQFGVSPANEAEQYPIFSVVGLRQSDGQEVDTLALAKPKVIAPAAGMSAAELNDMPDVTEIKKFRGGLKVKWARVNGIKSAATDVGAVGFISSLAAITNGNSVMSGSQHVNAFAIKNTNTTPASIPAAAQLINASMQTLDPSMALNASNDNLQICIDSGSTEQSGLIVIGGKGRQLSVDLRIQGDKCSA